MTTSTRNPEPSLQSAKPPELTRPERLRYARHIVMPEVGLEGQKKLKAARVVMIGAGGLGSPLGLYLAAAGVGTLGVVDFDVVDESNLQRQVLHGTTWVGKPKLESARSRLATRVRPNHRLLPTGTRGVRSCRRTRRASRRTSPRRRRT